MMPELVQKRHLLTMSKIIYLLPLLFLSCGQEAEAPSVRHPNIIYILADDLGYGDVSANNEEAKWKTGAIDQLAGEGVRFTDAHTGSAVCTPTRYGVLTGRYAWRTRLARGVLWGYDKHLIKSERTTVASFLKRNGYHTGCIGKWHLGLDFAVDESGVHDPQQRISHGPNQLGFDYFFGISSSLDIPPYFYIENDHITAASIDTIEERKGKEFWRKGAIGNDFKHEEVLPRLTEQAVKFISQQSEYDEPFFLYFPLPAPHTPILPTEEFLGKSNTNTYGDFVLMVDDVVAQVMAAVEDSGEKDETIIIFTSDNGCSPMADFDELAGYGHDPSYIYRGHKADIFEGGHRVPFIVRWPAKVEGGRVSGETICLTDLLATTAEVVGDSLKPEEGVDSYSILPAITGQNSAGPLRPATIHHSINGSFAIRQGPWKLAFCPGSGGWSYPRPAVADSLGLPEIQLYNLESDPDEDENLYEEQQKVVSDLSRLMMSYIDDGRSNPGPRQSNDREITLTND